MDPRTIALTVIALSAAASFITWVVVDAVVRVRKQRAEMLPSEIEARLARIEAAVDAIAIEVERNGELQRFTANLAQGAVPTEPRRIARPITPH